MEGQPTNDDAAIAEFHAAARRHKAKVYGIAGILGIAVGIVAVIVTFAASETAEYAGSGRRYELRLLAFGVAFVVMGLFAVFQAWRIGTGRAADYDYDPR